MEGVGTSACGDTRTVVKIGHSRMYKAHLAPSNIHKTHDDNNPFASFGLQNDATVRDSSFHSRHKISDSHDLTLRSSTYSLTRRQSKQRGGVLLSTSIFSFILRAYLLYVYYRSISNARTHFLFFSLSLYYNKINIKLLYNYLLYIIQSLYNYHTIIINLI